MLSELARKMRRAVDMGEDAPRLEERLALLREVRGAAPDAFDFIDSELIKHIDRTNQGLREAQEALMELHGEHERLTRPPWPVAVFRQCLPDSQQAVVCFNGASRLVTLARDVDAKLLCRGDDVFLNGDLNLLVQRASWGTSPVGETAEFVRHTSEDRMILRWRDDEIVVEVGQRLEDVLLKEGDLVRWNRDTFMALEKVDRNVTQRHFLDEVPDVGVDAVGGQYAALDAIKEALLTVHNARAYLHDLPQDLELTSAEPVARRVDRSDALLNQDDVSNWDLPESEV